jgi:hypothetical protein
VMISATGSRATTIPEPPARPVLIATTSTTTR